VVLWDAACGMMLGLLLRCTGPRLGPQASQSDLATAASSGNSGEALRPKIDGAKASCAGRPGSRATWPGACSYLDLC